MRVRKIDNFLIEFRQLNLSVRPIRPCAREGAAEETQGTGMSPEFLQPYPPVNLRFC